LNVAPLAEVLDVDERAPGLLQYVGRLQLAGLLQLDAVDARGGAGRHAYVGAVGELDGGVAACPCFNLVARVQGLARGCRVGVHRHGLVEQDQGRGGGDRRGGLNDEEPVTAAEQQQRHEPDHAKTAEAAASAPAAHAAALLRHRGSDRLLGDDRRRRWLLNCHRRGD